jgi:flotillin
MAEALIVGAVVLVGAVIGLRILRGLLQICPPNEVLIFSGRQNRLADGTDRGFRVVFGGRGWRVPLLETVDRMSLNVMEIPITIKNAYSKGGIALSVEAQANVKISSDRAVVGNAIERFLGRGKEELRRVSKETLEGHLRGVLATLTPEEVNEDRLKFSAELTRESEEDLKKLGLHLDTLTIQHVTDDSGYLDSIGRAAIATVLRDAEIAESDAKRDAEQAEAQNSGAANVAQANADANIAKMKNELRRIEAELEAKVRSEEERTAAAAREARAIAEQELQQIRAQLEEIRLGADTVMTAEAQKTAAEWRARGEAATILERGRAVAKALDLLHEAWAAAGDNALSIYLIEDLEKILKSAAHGVTKIKIDNLSMIDAGDGQTLAAYVGAYPAMLTSIFDAVSDTTGINIPKVLSGGGVVSGNGLTPTQPQDPAGKL